MIIGYLRNQQLVSSLDDIESIQIDWDVSAAAIKVKGSSSNADVLTEKVTITSGCGQGTMFGNLTADIEKFKLDFGLKIKQSVLLTIIDEVRRLVQFISRLDPYMGALCLRVKNAFLL